MSDSGRWSVTDFIHKGPWWRNRGILILNISLILPLITAFVSGLDTSMVNGLQILPAWQTYFNHPEGITLGLINSAQNIGALACLPFAPFSSDILGRRMTLFIGSIIMLAGVALQGTATNVATLIGSRLLLGVGLTLSTNASALLIAELAYPSQRGKLTSLYNTSWYAGSILSSWICFGAYERAHNSIWSWKVPILAQAVAPFLQVILVWFIPESPRFLVNKGLESIASRTLARFHALKDERDPLVVFEMAQIRHALKMEKDTSSSYWALFSTAANRKRMRIIFALAIFSQWSGNGLVSYYINLVLDGVGITSTVTKAGINGGLQLFNFAVAVSGAMLVDKVGRRPLFIISNAGMLIIFAMWTLTTGLFSAKGNKDAAKATIPLIFLFFFFYDIAYTPVLVAYTLEILPYNIRAKGFAFLNIIVCLAQLFNQLFNPWALKSIGWKYYLVYCGLLVCELIFVIFYIVETKGRTLEETAVLFDGEQKPQNLTQMGGAAATMTMNLNVKPLVHIRDEELYNRGTKKDLVGEVDSVSYIELVPNRRLDRHSKSSSEGTIVV